MTTKEYAEGLRQLADWADLHPDVAVPYTIEVADRFIIRYVVLDKGEVQTLLRLIGGAWKKEATAGSLIFIQDLGFVTMRIIVSQSLVCERKSVRIEIVPAQPAYTREVVEWDCAPILGEVAEPA